MWRVRVGEQRAEKEECEHRAHHVRHIKEFLMLTYPEL